VIATTPQSRIRNHDMNAAWRHVDVVLIGLVLAASAFGALMVFSATRHRSSLETDIGKHVMFIGLGLVAMAACAAVDYQRIRDWSRLIYVGMVLVLGAVLVVGSVHRNIRAWFDIGPIQIQPAEFAKLATIVVVAAYLGTLGDRLRLRHLVVSLVMLGIPIGLIMLQPDLGTTLVFVVIGAGMLVVAGVPMRYLGVLLVLGVAGVFFILNSNTLDQYQKDRLTAFANPDSASEAVTYNTARSQEAVASGGLAGQDLFEGPQTKGGFVPEQQTDFIFTVPAEELGFLGAGGLLLLLGAVLWRIWRTAQIARDPVGRLICVGVLCMFVFHIFENVGMNLGIMPVTGIPLPFVSYGGSSLIAVMAGIGILLNVSRYGKDKQYVQRPAQQRVRPRVRTKAAPT
jgi:rod shape determining protein RodA